MVFDPKPAIIGHRGFGAGERNGYRENTLESYLAAMPMHRDQPRRMDNTIKKVIRVAHRAGLEVVVWQASPNSADMLAAAGADAFSVNDVPGVLAAVAGDAPPPHPIMKGSNDG